MTKLFRSRSLKKKRMVLRVAIVNDSLFAVDCLRKIVILGGYSVAWVAHNGVEAVAACLIDRPAGYRIDGLIYA